jgi:hypothetical protein
MHGDHDPDPPSPSPRPDSDHNSNPSRGFYILVRGEPRRATLSEWLAWTRGTMFGETRYRPCTCEPTIEHTTLYLGDCGAGPCDDNDSVVIITEFVSRHPRINSENKVLLWVTVVIGGPEHGAKWYTITLGNARRDHFGAVQRHLRRGWRAEGVPGWAEVGDQAGKRG